MGSVNYLQVCQFYHLDVQVMPRIYTSPKLLLWAHLGF